MRLPDYKGGSIVNLMSSISKAFGTRHPYPELRLLPSNELKGKKVVLLVLDGIGYQYVKGRDGFLRDNLRGRIDTVFVPTTACAVSAFLTGLPPQQTAMTGWYMNLKELGTVSAILPFEPRFGHLDLSRHDAKIADIIPAKSFFSKLKVKSYTVSPSGYSKSGYNMHMCKGSRFRGYNSFQGLAKQVLRASGKRAYIYAYWPGFDMLSHQFGPESTQAERHYRQLDRAVRGLAEKLGKNTLLIVTADHGFDTTRKYHFIEDHPKLKEMLSLPLCGDSRTIYCYVKADRGKEFVRVFRNSGIPGKIIESSKLMKKGAFGLGKPASQLSDRIGDYTILMEKGHALRDTLINREPKKIPGNHSGISREEMEVPLVIYNLD